MVDTREPTLDPVPTELLRAVEERVDRFDERERRLTVARDDRIDAEAHGHHVARGGPIVRDPLVVDERSATLCDRHRASGVGVRKQQRELFATESSDEIVGARGGDESLGDALQAFVAGDVSVAIVELLEEVEVEQDQRERLSLARRRLPFSLEDEVEHSSVRDVGEPVLVRERFELALQTRERLFVLLPLADVEHEADERLDLAVFLADDVDDVADPDVSAVRGLGSVVGLVVDAGLRLGHAEVHDVVAIVRVHPARPVLDRDPALRLPAEERLDLRPDVGEPHRRPIDPPGNRLGRFEECLVRRVVGLHGDPRAGRGR